MVSQAAWGLALWVDTGKTFSPSRLWLLCYSGFSRETESIGDIYYMYNIYLHIYKIIIYIRNHIGMAHEIMEAEKSHDLPSASWRTRKANGVI